MQAQQDAVGSFTGIAGFPLQRHYSAELQRRTASFCRGVLGERGCLSLLDLSRNGLDPCIVHPGDEAVGNTHRHALCDA